jgi:hypothetical protein
MAFILADTKKVSASVSFVDAKGNAASVQGEPAWSSSDETIATVTADAGGMSATIVAVGPLGMAQISVSADADLGDGVQTVTGLADIEVQASQAVAASLTLGEPSDQ